MNRQPDHDFPVHVIQKMKVFGEWTPGQYGNETVVECAGCGASIAVCESTVTPWRSTHLFACCPRCEQMATDRLNRLDED